MIIYGRHATERLGRGHEYIMGLASVLTEATDSGDRCVTLASGTSADIDSGPFRYYYECPEKSSNKILMTLL